MKKVNPVTAFVFGISVTAAFFLGAGAGRSDRVPETIQARTFEVVNGDGTVVVQFSSFEGDGVVRVMSKESKVSALIAAGKSCGGISLFTDGVNTAFLGSTDNKVGGSVSVYDMEEKKIACLGAGIAHGDIAAGFLDLRSPFHGATLSVCFTENGFPHIEGKRPSKKWLHAWPEIEPLTKGTAK